MSFDDVLDILVAKEKFLRKQAKKQAKEGYYNGAFQLQATAAYLAVIIDELRSQGGK